MRMKGIKQKVYHLTYDKQAMNKTALRLQRSVDEVRKVLDRTGMKSPK